MDVLLFVAVKLAFSERSLLLLGWSTASASGSSISFYSSCFCLPSQSLILSLVGTSGSTVFYYGFVSSFSLSCYSAKLSLS